MYRESGPILGLILKFKVYLITQHFCTSRRQTTKILQRGWRFSKLMYPEVPLNQWIVHPPLALLASPVWEKKIHIKFKRTSWEQFWSERRSIYSCRSAHNPTKIRRNHVPTIIAAAVVAAHRRRALPIPLVISTISFLTIFRVLVARGPGDISRDPIFDQRSEISIL